MKSLRMGEKMPKEQRVELNNEIGETYGTVWATEE
jgi:hypothetical protein